MMIPNVNIRVSARQMMLIKLSGIIGIIFFGGIRTITGQAGAQGYLAILAGGIISYGITIISLMVGRRFPKQTPFIYARSILGHIIGTLLMLVLIFTALMAVSLVIRNLGDFLITAILPNTPLSANILLMLFLVCVGCYLGLETLARFNELFAPIVLIAWIFVIVAAVPKIDLGWLRPLFDISLEGLLSTTLVASTLLVDGMIELMFFPFVADQKSLAKYLGYGIATGTFIVLLLQVSVIGVYSPALARTFAFPVLQLAQDATLGVFLGRIEAIFLVVWVVGTFIRVSVVFYGTSLGMAQTLGVKNHRFFIPPMAAGVFYIAFKAGNVPESFNYDALFSKAALLVQVGIPALLLLGAVLMRKRERTT